MSERERKPCEYHFGCFPRTFTEGGFTFVEHQISPGRILRAYGRGPWSLSEIEETFRPVGEAPEGSERLPGGAEGSVGAQDAPQSAHKPRRASGEGEA